MAATIDLRGCQFVEIAATIDLGCSLSIGIAATIDLGAVNELEVRLQLISGSFFLFFIIRRIWGKIKLSIIRNCVYN